MAKGCTRLRLALLSLAARAGRCRLLVALWHSWAVVAVCRCPLAARMPVPAATALSPRAVLRVALWVAFRCPQARQSARARVTLVSWAVPLSLVAVAKSRCLPRLVWISLVVPVHMAAVLWPSVQEVAEPQPVDRCALRVAVARAVAVMCSF